MTLSSSFTADWRMRDIIKANSLMLMTLSRFGISLGFGNATIGQVCESNNIDTPTFLAVANFCSDRPVDPSESIKLTPLMAYLKGAHTYFLDFSIPRIRHKLISVIDSVPDEVGLVVLRFFDDWFDEVRKHMDYENSRVFTYVDQLLAGRTPSDFCIDIFAAHHDSIALKLEALKDILIRFAPAGAGDLLNVVLFDIINSEDDLKLHCELEDGLFVPAVAALEEQVSATAEADGSPDDDDASGGSADPRLELLSPREREIVAQIALGRSNKEIADALCLSVHTVTTHRRNITAKLKLHSVAAITIFAVINHLVDLEDIDV